jgi:hypothetical protein
MNDIKKNNLIMLLCFIACSFVLKFLDPMIAVSMPAYQALGFIMIYFVCAFMLLGSMAYFSCILGLKISNRYAK